MAVRYEKRYVDDLDGADIDTDDVQSIAFSFDGKDYSIDLRAENADAFREAISPYLDVATRVTAGTKRKSARKSAGTTASGETKAIREWARNNGHTVSDRGRIPTDIVEAYRAAN